MSHRSNEHRRVAPPNSPEIEALIRMTKEVFEETPVLFLEVDPEGGDEYVVVEVPVKGSVDLIHQQTQLRHRRLAREFNEQVAFALSPLFA